MDAKKITFKAREITLHDGMPVPKVIEFGIAKATQQDLTEKTGYTQFQQFIGTPAYMSTWQAFAANQARHEAETARLAESERRQTALSQRDRAEGNALQSQRNLYAADIKAIQQYLAEACGNIIELMKNDLDDLFGIVGCSVYQPFCFSPVTNDS
jgi:hypothetical protein